MSTHESARRRAWARVDLGAVRRNALALAKAAAPARLWAVVKADAYGHGVAEVARTLREAGLDRFCVATVAEGLELRAAGCLREEILLFGPYVREDLDEIGHHKLIPTVSAWTQLAELNTFGKKRGEPVACHLKVDTGMGRWGLTPEEVVERHEKIFQLPFVHVAGLFSHLSSSGDPGDEYTAGQARSFLHLADFLELNNIWFGHKHLLNSGGLLHYRAATVDGARRALTMDGARPGLALYGYWPGKPAPRVVKLTPAFSLHARVAQVRRLPAGAFLSYDRTFQAKRDTDVALLPIGYADGYATAFSNRGQVLVGRKLCPVVGRVTMDTTLVDVTGAGTRAGDEAVLLGGDHPELALERVAAAVGSIPYELTCRISRRVPRLYA